MFSAYGIMVLSNSFEYENRPCPVSGKMIPHTIGYSRDKILHSMNKHGFIYSRVPKDQLRPNVILMGDIIEDTLMTSEDRHDVTLKIGFLNSQHQDPAVVERYL